MHPPPSPYPSRGTGTHHEGNHLLVDIALGLGIGLHIGRHCPVPPDLKFVRHQGGRKVVDLKEHARGERGLSCCYV